VPLVSIFFQFQFHLSIKYKRSTFSMRNKKAESFNSWPFITSKHTWYSKMQCTSWFPIHSGEFSNFQIQNISKWCRATLRATEVNTVLMSSGSFPHLVLIRAHLQLFEMIDLAKPRFFQISAPHFFPLRFLNTWPCTIANSLRFPPFLWIGLQEGWEGKSSSALLPYRLMYRKSEIKKKKNTCFAQEVEPICIKGYLCFNCISIVYRTVEFITIQTYVVQQEKVIAGYTKCKYWRRIKL
jgi:hypothetical protein